MSIKIRNNPIINFIKGLIIFIIVVNVFFNIGPYVMTTVGARCYIAKNYKGAEIVKTSYDKIIALVLVGGEYIATVKEGDYEFNVTATNLFASLPSIHDEYGAYRFGIEESLNTSLRDFVINHELFSKYNYKTSDLKIYGGDEIEFVTKEKADKNTIEKLTVAIEDSFNSDEVEIFNSMTSEDKHKLLNDIDKYLKDQGINVISLELGFYFDEKSETNSVDVVPDFKEILSKNSEEFLKYKKEKQLTGKSNKVIKEIIGRVSVEDWNISKVYKNEDYNRIVVSLENQKEWENVRGNIKKYFHEVNDELSKEEIRDDVVIVLNDSSHESNVIHYMEYSRI